jgi:hypothetical protein
MASMTTARTDAGWRIVSASIIGEDHRRMGKVNQDRWSAQEVTSGLLVCAVADGAGSRTRSDEGALLAVESATTAAEKSFGETLPRTESEWKGAVANYAKSCLDLFDRSLKDRAAQIDSPDSMGDGSSSQLRSSFGTTLLAVVAKHPWYGFVSVGDCFLVVDRVPGGPHLVPARKMGEHAGETVFMTSRERDSHLDHGVIHDDHIRGFALCSDGLCEGMLTIRRARAGHYYAAPREFSQYFDHFCNDQVDACDLERKLSSQQFAETSGDDKTMVMAVRRR